MKRVLISLLFAPGVVLHELGHLIFCWLAGVKVFRVKFFGFGKIAGFVEHAEPDKFLQSLLITFGPLTLNSLVSLVLFSLLTKPYFTWPHALETWIAVAAACHAFPSNGDAVTLLFIIKQKLRRNPLVAIGYPFAGLIYILNFLKSFRLQFLYAAVLFWLGNGYLK